MQMFIAYGFDFMVLMAKGMTYHIMRICAEACRSLQLPCTSVSLVFSLVFFFLKTRVLKSRDLMALNHYLMFGKIPSHQTRGNNKGM